MAMNLKLNIEEDEELRKYLKELIRNQVKSVIREEITNVVKEIAKERLQVNNTNMVDEVFRSAINEIVSKELKLTSSSFQRSYIKEFAEGLIRDHINQQLKKGLL